jgi:hypothetical protein
MAYQINEIKPVELIVESEDFEKASPDARIIAVALARVADALYWLGNGDAIGANGARMGAIEGLSKELKDGLEAVSMAVNNIKE